MFRNNDSVETLILVNLVSSEGRDPKFKGARTRRVQKATYFSYKLSNINQGNADNQLLKYLYDKSSKINIILCLPSQEVKVINDVQVE